MSRAVLLRSLACLLALPACGGPAVQPARGPAAVAASPPEVAASRSNDSAAPAAPALALEAALEPEGVLAIRVRNVASDRVQLAPALQLERRAEHGYVGVEGAQVALRGAASGGCVELVSGAELRPAVPRPRAAASAQTYRLIARGCATRWRVESAPFELP